MTETRKQVEAVPAAYPTSPAGLSAAAQSIDAAVIWQRIEAYIAYRWTQREVVWTVEGEGEWLPPLAPVTISGVEKFELGWVDVTLPEGPYGYCLPSDGPYRVTANVGGGDVPAGVLEAYKRLAEYMASPTGKAGATSEKTSVGPFDIEVSRNAAFMARAMQNSGAGDLLRNYRRVQ